MKWVLTLDLRNAQNSQPPDCCSTRGLQSSRTSGRGTLRISGLGSADIRTSPCSSSDSLMGLWAYAIHRKLHLLYHAEFCCVDHRSHQWCVRKDPPNPMVEEWPSDEGLLGCILNQENPRRDGRIGTCLYVNSRELLFRSCWGARNHELGENQYG